MRKLISCCIVVFIFSTIKGGERIKAMICGFNGCEVVPNDPLSLTKHRFVHTDQRPFCCSKCGQQGFIPDLKKHFAKQCKHASIKETTLTPATKALLDLPLKQKIEKPVHYLCDIRGCTSKSRLVSKIAKHRRKKHLSQKKYFCSLCYKEFNAKDGKKHIPLCSRLHESLGQLIRAKLFATVRAVLTAPVIGVYSNNSRAVLENVITDDASSIEYLPDSDEEVLPIPSTLSFQDLLMILPSGSEESLVGSS